MKRVVLKHNEKDLILFDAIIYRNGIISVHKCIDKIYLKLFKQVINGNYEIEFEDEKFVINSNNVYENLYKLKENPLYKNLEIIEYNKKLNVVRPYKRRHKKSSNFSKYRTHNTRFRKRKNKSIVHKIRKIYVKTDEHSHINSNFDNHF